MVNLMFLSQDMKIVSLVGLRREILLAVVGAMGFPLRCPLVGNARRSYGSSVIVSKMTFNVSFMLS